MSTPRKIAIGMGIAALAYIFLMIYSGLKGYPSALDFKALDVGVQNAMKAGPWVLIVTYFFLTVAELFISPLGISFVTKVAPKHLLGLCQGLWLGATALGNLLIGFPANGQRDAVACWLVFAVVCLTMGVMYGMVNWLRDQWR